MFQGPIFAALYLTIVFVFVFPPDVPCVCVRARDNNCETVREFEAWEDGIFCRKDLHLLLPEK